MFCHPAGNFTCQILFMVFPTMFNVISWLLLNPNSQQTKMKSHAETNRGLKASNHFSA